MFRVVYASFGVLEQAFIREINLYFHSIQLIIFFFEQYITSCNNVRMVDKVSNSASFRWSVQIFIFYLLEMIETHPTVKTRLNNSKY